VIYPDDGKLDRKGSAAMGLSRLGLALFVVGAASSKTVAWDFFPLNRQPVWTSEAAGHVATGGGWVDVDGDGWIDMVVANGNDIERQPVVIYHNRGDGSFPGEATWRSSDIDYHGHLDLGDINGDGLPDLAVAVYLGPAGFASPGGAKVYLNRGDGGFSHTPDWQSDESFYTFSVALGDADGDGDLDLACACGEDYTDKREPQRIFFNHQGTLEAVASWRSSERDYALDVAWVDVDRDGDLDVAFCGASSPLRLYVNEQTSGGGLPTVASWENADLPQLGNTIAFGDWDGDGFPELAVADNHQLGGEGRFKVYANNQGELAKTPAWTSSASRYGSHVSWIDLDRDGDLDLAAGAWWDRVMVFENAGGALGATPAWTSLTSSVIESMFWGDVSNQALRGEVLRRAGDGMATLFVLPFAPARSVDEVRVGGQTVSDWVAHPSNGWVSLASPPAAGEEVVIRFTYTTAPKLGVTNWDDDQGNFVFDYRYDMIYSPDALRTGRRRVP
jgi:hypothetical protein